MTKLMKNLSVKFRLAGFVIFMLLLIVGIGLGGLNGMRRANNSLSEVYEHEVLPLKELREIDILFQVNIVGCVDKALFEQITWESCVANVKDANAKIEQKWKNLFSQENVTGNKNIEWLAPASPLVASTGEVVNVLINYLEKHDDEHLDSFTDEKLYPLADDYKSIINSLIQNRLATVKKEYDSAQSDYDVTKKWFLVVSCLGIVISTLASVLLVRGIDEPLSKMTAAMKTVMNGDLTLTLGHGRHDEFGLLIHGYNQMVKYLRDLVGQIQRSGIQVTSSITELAATNKQQEVTANEHAATASEIAASTSEIVATGASLLQTMKKVNSLTRNAAFAAEEGHAGLGEIDKTMVTMENATGAIVNKLSVLSEKAGNIAGVVRTINKIADQTNLLSLNAAIEAEKAGEYGAGFSVVATEIRRLADQTAVATFDIEQMVKEVQSAISAAVMGIDKFAEDAHHSVGDVRKISAQLSGVIEQVEVLTPQIETLTNGIDAQTQGANQISEAINQLNEAAQQTAESLTQTSASISQLHQAALLLQEGAARFQVDAEGDDYAASPV